MKKTTKYYNYTIKITTDTPELNDIIAKDIEAWIGDYLANDMSFSGDNDIIDYKLIGFYDTKCSFMFEPGSIIRNVRIEE